MHPDITVIMGVFFTVLGVPAYKFIVISESFRSRHNLLESGQAMTRKSTGKLGKQSNGQCHSADGKKKYYIYAKMINTWYLNAASRNPESTNLLP